MRNRPLWQALLLSAVALVLSTWIASYWEGQEDAYITYAYAKRLAAGEGFTFTPASAPTLGTTTPLYTLLLAAVAFVGVPPHFASPWIGSLAHALTALLLLMIGRRLFGPVGAFACGAFWAIALPMFFRLGGMETPLLIALVALLALAELNAPASTSGAVLVGLLLLCRPDSALLALLLWSFWALDRTSRASLPRNTAVIGLVCLPWVLYAVLTFGTIVPSSMVAKMAIPVSGLVNAGSFLNEYFPYPKIFPGVVLLSVLGWVELWRTSRRLRPFLIWIPLYGLSMRLGGAPDFAWYYAPPLLFAPLLITAGARFLAATAVTRKVLAWIASARFLPPGPDRWLPALAAAGLLATWAGAGLEATRPVRKPSLAPSVHHQLALVARAVAGPDDVVASLETGQLAYFSERRVLDLLALTTPEVLPWARKRDFRGAIDYFRPALVMTTNPRLVPGYLEIARAPYHGRAYGLWARGDLDLQRWDRKVPPRLHPDVLMFDGFETGDTSGWDATRP